MTPDPQSIRTFRASSLPEALAQVKRELGPDALVLGTRQIERRGIGALAGPLVEITAAKAVGAGTEARSHEGTKGREQGTGNREQGAPAHAGSPRTTDTPRRRAFDMRHSTFDILTERDPLRRWYERLVQRELGEHLARIVVEHVRRRVGRGTTPADIDAAVREELARLMPAAGGIKLRPDGPTRIALVGPPGSGKTTTLAKIAAHFRLREKKRVAIVSLDAHRLGTAEQLERYGGIIGAAVWTIRTPEEAQAIFGVAGAAESNEATQQRSDSATEEKAARGNREQGTGSASERPLPVASDLRARRGFDTLRSSFDHRGEAAPHFAIGSSNFDLVLIDTPGVSPNDVELRRELDELLRIARPDEVHLVLPASLRPEIQRRTIEAFALFGVERVVLSRLDEASGFGVVLEMLRQLDWAVSYLTTGQKVPTDLKKACGAELAALVLPADAVGA